MSIPTAKLTGSLVRSAIIRLTWPAIVALLFPINGGCSQLLDPSVPEPIQKHVEPVSETPYFLYVPSSYDRTMSWPLVVVCHSAFPDSANQQLRHWTEQAQSRGFLVVAPKIRSAFRPLGSSVTDNLEKLRQDARLILDTVRHVRAAHNVSESRVFIHGWSGGAVAALYVGLLHPDVFRSVSLMQPKFDRGLFSELADRIDPYQAVFVNYNSYDAIFGKNARQCVDWLRDHGAFVLDDPFGPARASQTERVVDFYEDDTRKRPWMRVFVSQARSDGPNALQFRLRCSYNPVQYRWQFGDGDESPVAEPIHVYAEPGTYRVSLTIQGPAQQRNRRTFDVQVPEATLSFHRAPSDDQ